MYNNIKMQYQNEEIVNNQNNLIEPLLDPNNERFTILPIKFPAIWEMYKIQQSAYWKAEEIDFSNFPHNPCQSLNHGSDSIKLIFPARLFHFLYFF